MKPTAERQQGASFDLHRDNISPVQDTLAASEQRHPADQPRLPLALSCLLGVYPHGTWGKRQLWCLNRMVFGAVRRTCDQV